jgi:magnesium chelatase family protein
MSDCVHPCPCGWLNDPQKACGCAPAVVTKHQKRISGPLLDRIDIHIEVPRVDYEKLSDNRMREAGEAIRKRVQAARNIQQLRFANYQSGIICNAAMRVGEIQQFCRLQAEGAALSHVEVSESDAGGRKPHQRRSAGMPF